MSSENRILWWGVGVVTLGIVVLLAWPTVVEELAPQPVASFVALEGPDGVARVGARLASPGEATTLHAVLEARDRKGETLYYTEASRLEIHGEAVPPDSLRRWDGPLEAKILWFTVEGAVPYLVVATEADLERFRFEELFRADWPRAWSIPASLQSRYDAHLRRTDHYRERDFGTQRYHVRVELYAEGQPYVAQSRFKSWGAGEVQERGAEFPRLTASLSGPLAPASRIFGLTQIELDPEAPREWVEEVVDLSRRDLAFTRLTILRELLAGRESLASLEWREIELSRSGLQWGEEVGSGDLVRVGARVAVLYRSMGGEGELAAADLCFDFERGAVVAPLEEIFDTEGRVEWASLASPQESAPTKMDIK